MDLNRLKSKVAELEFDGEFRPEMKKVIVAGIPNIVRLVGEWNSVYRAWLKCPDGKVRPFNVKNDFQGVSPLYTLIKELFKKDKIFDQRTGKVSYQFTYINRIDPSLIDIIYPTINNRNRGWSISQIFLLNCIDRMDNWCKDNKHTKLLVKSEAEIGIGGNAFEALQKEAENWGDPETYDLNFTKTGKGLDTVYGVSKANPQKYNMVVEGPLTPEERAYELYDLEKLASLSNSEYILKYLGEVIQKIDNSLGTSYYEQIASFNPKIPANISNNSIPANISNNSIPANISNNSIPANISTTPNISENPTNIPNPPINFAPTNEPEKQTTFSFRKTISQNESVQNNNVLINQPPNNQTVNPPTPSTTESATNETVVYCPICHNPTDGKECKHCGIKLV